MAEIQYDSMRVPFSNFVGDILWTGTYLMLIPMNHEGGLSPLFEQVVGTRGPVTGRKKWLSRSKYTPHQGARECTRRQNQWGL